jgi:hypothetical protein
MEIMTNYMTTNIMISTTLFHFAMVMFFGLFRLGINCITVNPVMFDIVRLLIN